MNTTDITTAVKNIVANNPMQSEMFIHMHLQKQAKALGIAWSRQMPTDDVDTIVNAFKARTGLK